MAAGRPTGYSLKIADEIIKKIENGQSVRFIGQEDDMPAESTIHEWLKKHSEFSEKYVRAKEAYADSVFEEILEIADDSRNDWVERETRRGSFIALNDEAIGRARLRVDARKWMLGKLAPKKYGDKLEIEAKVEGEVKITIGGNV